MTPPETIEEFVTQAESAIKLPHYRDDFVEFTLGSCEYDADSDTFTDHKILITNTQESGAMGTYRHIFLRHGKDLVEKGFVVLSQQQLQDLRKAFNPFNDDGKTHPNVDALDALITLPQTAVIKVVYD